jgi:homoserine O-succinyltransferase
MQGLPNRFPVPVSRRSETRAEDLPRSGAVQVLIESPESGLCLLQEPARRAVYMFNHLEYDADTLPGEYRRDLAAGLPILPPRNVFPQDDPARPPLNAWRPYGLRLFRNWLDSLAAQAEGDTRPRLARTAAAE